MPPPDESERHQAGERKERMNERYDMPAYRAVAIFSDIGNGKISDMEKAQAIAVILGRPLRQLDQVKKTAMLEVIRWLWSRCFGV